MGNISVNEVDNTTYNINNLATDNIVYVPGSAITGDSSGPVLLTNYNAFISKFGSHGCDSDDMTFDYVSGILLSGFYVLFQRIIGNSKTATTTLKFKNSEDNSTTIDFTVSFRYPGTLGNEYSLRFDSDNSGGIILRILYNKAIKESIRLLSNGEELSLALERLSKISTSGNTDYTSNYVNITCNSPTIEATEHLAIDTGETLYTLAGGTDISNADLESQIADTSTYYTNDGTANKLLDKYLYMPKFITSGGHIGSAAHSSVTKSINDSLISIATRREDCIALIDIPYDIDNDLVYQTYSEYNSSYATAYAPWQYISVRGSYRWMPPSYVFLVTLASYIGNDSSRIYDIPSGIDRMTITGIKKSQFDIGEAILNNWQNNDYAINPIMKLRNYGYVIYGQKTLMHVDSQLGIKSAFQELGIRIIVNEIKRTIFDICLSLSFSNNVYETWHEFKLRLSDRILDKLVVAKRISNYDLKLQTDDTNASAVKGVVSIYVNNSLEYFDINVEVNSNDEVSVIEAGYTDSTGIIE